MPMPFEIPGHELSDALLKAMDSHGLIDGTAGGGWREIKA